jgi:dephospho-CoA kinase
MSSPAEHLRNLEAELKLPLQVGLTGGMGSGKSYVARWFVQRGHPLYHSDVRAKAVMHENATLRQQLIDTFGTEVFTPAGELNRQWLAQRAFAHPDTLTRLNALVHPVVIQDYMDWVSSLPAGTPLALKEAAILFESGTARFSDVNILVYAPLATRLQRIMDRDGLKREDAYARVRRQWPDTRKLNLADYLVVNDGYTPLEPQLAEVEGMLLANS